MFRDRRLQLLIALALDANRDLRIAALNAEATRAQLRVQRAQALPSVSADTSYARQRQPAGLAAAGAGLAPDSGTTGGSGGFEFGQVSVQAVLSGFEIDLFGRLRAMNEAALHRWLATVAAQRAVRLAVIGAVANAYWTEQLSAEQLSLAHSSVSDWRTTLALISLRKDAGQASGADVAEAQGQLQMAKAETAQREREYAQAANALSLAVGMPVPADLPDAVALMDQPPPVVLGAGAPSELLVRRPDIAEAEQVLRAASADVGAARAAFLPRISLTAAFGFASLALDNLFQGSNRSWTFAPTIAQPIFGRGELRGNLELAKLRRSSAVSSYEKIIQTAFSEVADGLSAQATYAVQMEARRGALMQASQGLAYTELAYRAGRSSRLELVDAQRSTYAARQALIATRRDQLAAAVALYLAIGGDEFHARAIPDHGSRPTHENSATRRQARPADHDIPK